MRLYDSIIDIWNPIGHAHKFKNLEAFCLFLGYPRSGHSIISAMLDAHPEMVVAHEVHVLKMLDEGTTKWRIFLEILKRSRQQAAQGRIQNIYSYKIENQYQGTYRQLKVIGDKKGGGSALLLSKNGFLLEKLQKKIKLPIKIIHITRNPYDAISTSLIRRQEKRNKPFSKRQLHKEIDEFFIKASAIQKVKEQGKFVFFEAQQEVFISDIKKNIAALVRFLGLKTSEDYLDACAKIINPIPNQSRHKIPFWDNELTGQVQKRINTFDFFKSYNFNA